MTAQRTQDSRRSSCEKLDSDLQAQQNAFTEMRGQVKEREEQLEAEQQRKAAETQRPGPAAEESSGSYTDSSMIFSSIGV